MALRWRGLCGATVAVTAVAVAATSGEPTTLLLVVALLTGVASAVLADRRAWLTTTTLAIATFLLAAAAGDEPHRWSYVIFIAFAALLGRAQRWMRRQRHHDSYGWAKTSSSTGRDPAGRRDSSRIRSS